MTQTLEQLQQTLEDAAAFAAHPPLTPVVEETRDNLAQETQGNFEGSHDPDGFPWADPKTPLQPAGRPLLVLTGALLLTAVTQLADAPAGPTGFEADPAWGPDYGIFHDQGTVKMAARPFTGWSETAAEKASNDIGAFVVHGLAEVFP